MFHGFAAAKIIRKAYAFSVLTIFVFKIVQHTTNFAGGITSSDDSQSCRHGNLIWET